MNKTKNTSYETKKAIESFKEPQKIRLVDIGDSPEAMSFNEHMEKLEEKGYRREMLRRKY